MNHKFDILFVSIYFFYTVVLSILTPPFQVADEDAHFFRASQLAELKLVPERRGDLVGGFLPKSTILEVQLLKGEIPFNPGHKFNPAKFAEVSIGKHVDGSEFISFPNTALYSPVPYFLSGTSISISKIYKANVWQQLCVARVMNCVFAAFLLLLSCKAAPHLRAPFLTVCTFPIFTFQVASISVDSLLLPMSVLFMSLFFRLSEQLTDPSFSKTKETEILFCAAFIFIILSKQAYVFFILPLLYLLIMKYLYIKSLSASVWVLAAGCLGAILWNLIISDYYAPGRTDIYVNPRLQLLYLAANPFDFLFSVGKTLSIELFEQYYKFVGVLGWLDTPVNKIYVHIFYLLFVASIILSAFRSLVFDMKVRLVLLSTLFCSFFTIFLFIYLSWNKPGTNGLIAGIQARYFLPIVGLLPMALIGSLSRYFKENKGKNFELIALSIPLFSIFTCMIVTISTLGHRYYGSANIIDSFAMTKRNFIMMMGS